MEDALEMPAASTITAMAFAATALALGRKRLLSTSVSTPPPVPLRLFRRTVDSSALPANPKSGYDLPSPTSASGAGGPSFDIDSDAEENEDYDESAADDSDSGGAMPTRTSTSRGKLWSKAQFPEGTSGAKNWDMSNLLAAQTWVCPCPDRRNCIGSERVPLLDLYEHRKAFRTKAGAKGGLRDANRIEMQGHYDAKTTSFSLHVQLRCGEMRRLLLSLGWSRKRPLFLPVGKQPRRPQGSQSMACWAVRCSLKAAE